MMNIKEKYNKVVLPEMKKKFGWTNDLQAPRIEKVVLNSGIGKYIKDSGMVDDVRNSLKVIGGQKPSMSKSKKSIAGFKTREGLEIGMKVTLRGKRMWDFLERLVGAAMPRIRDFQGIKESAVDQNGNLNIGIREHVIFPEIIPENVKNMLSFQVTIVTSARNKEEATEFFKLLNFPLKKD